MADNKQLRSVCISVLGHVDHGKSSILDKIRKSSIVATEAGSITQSIGASIIPLPTIKKACGSLLDSTKIKFTIPGLLFIDTPGHAAFTNLRKRGGSLADIAILVIDITEGMKPQTMESIEILKSHKTPFIIAANKIDKIHGWKSENKLLIQTIDSQADEIKTKLDTLIYELVGKLHELGFQSERFDRIEDHTKQLAIVPCSAVTGDGIPELLLVLIGMAQKYLEQTLKFEVSGNAKGTILEVKETQGLGKTIDVIIFDGTLKKGDALVIGGLDQPIVTKVKALLEPNPLQEMRDKKSKFKQVQQIVAATGVKISAPGMEDVVAGMPVVGCPTSISKEELEEIEKEVQEQVLEVMIETDEVGLILKADTLGSLEALITLFQEKGLTIRKATIGNISKKDVMEAASNKEANPIQSVVLGFNVEVPPDVETYANEMGVKIINSQVIYHLLEQYEKWVEAETKRLEAKELEGLTRPFKLQILPGYVFRQNNPAVCGVEIMAGTLRSGIQIMKKEGKTIDFIKGIQKEKETISEAEKGEQVAIALPKTTIGRQLHENDIVYSYIPEEDFKKLKKLKQYLSPEEKEILKEIAQIMRANAPMWGV